MEAAVLTSEDYKVPPWSVEPTGDYLYMYLLTQARSYKGWVNDLGAASTKKAIHPYRQDGGVV